MLRTRVVTALVLLFAFLAALFWLPDWGWAGLAVLLALAAAWEWAGLVDRRGAGKARYAAAIGAITLAVLISDARMATSLALYSFALSAVLWAVVIPAWLMQKWRIASLAGQVAGAVLIVPTVLALVMLRAMSPYFLLVVVAVIWAADISAYFVGRALGRHKLAPQISPGKSWEGAYGAVAGVLTYGFVVLLATGHTVGVEATALFAALLTVTTILSIVGDLFESLAKRQAGVKDSGSILPGHGGLLDRIDSLTATLPAIALGSVTPLLRAKLGL